MEIYEKEEQMEEKHTSLQDLDPKMFPSLRGEIDWWSCRSRSSLSNPSTRFKKYGRDRGNCKLLKVKTMKERERKQPTSPRRKKGAFYSPPPRKSDHYSHLDRQKPARLAKARQNSELKQRGNQAGRSSYFWPWAG
jgi:hypothetical protein